MLKDFADGSRAISYPKNGNFDVIVLETKLPAEALAPEGLLSGKPVYTAYLNVGLKREWIIQYCLANDPGGAGQGGMVVSLGNEPVIRAPYIQSLILPPGWQHNRRFLLFKGKINSEGGLEVVKPVGESSEQQRTLLPYLAMWRFRPATRDQAAIPVELVLAIPPEPFN